MASRKRPTGSDQDDLFNPEIELLLPTRLAIDGKVLGSPVRQLVVPARRVRCRLRPFAIRRVDGHETTLESGEIPKVISAPSDRKVSPFIAGATGSATGIFVPALLIWSNEKAAFSALVG